MTRPRPFLRSLVAATCGTTLLTAAVLGAGGAAFAEEPTSEVAVAEEAPTSEADPEAGSDAATPVAESTSSDGTDPVDPEQPAPEAAAYEAPAEEPAAEPAPRADAPEADGAPSVVTPAEAPAASTRAAAAEDQVAPLAADMVTPSLRVDAPRSVAFAGGMREFDVVVENWEALSAEDKARMGDPAVLITLPADQEMAHLVTFEILENGTWKDLELDWFEDQLETTFPLPDGTARLRVGVTQASYEAFWQDLLDVVDFQTEDLADDNSFNAFAGPLAEQPEPLSPIRFSTQLQMDGLDSEAESHTINVVAPGLDVVGAAPDEVSAGDSFKVSYRVSNRTGYDYPASAPLQLFQVAALLTEEELDEMDELDAMLDAGEISEDEYLDLLFDLAAVNPGELTVSCSAGDAPARPIPFADSFLGTGGVLYSGGLKTGDSINVNCSVSVSSDIPDAGLVLVPMLTIGKGGAPLIFDQELVQEVSILAAESGQPKPTPAKPAPAQPAPVRPAPTPSSPPAAAPVRQVSTTALPRTGTDPLPLAAAGLGLVLAGAAALLGGRRRAHN
jgi:LPXTG-motif cell wall-anchored protein